MATCRCRPRLEKFHETEANCDYDDDDLDYEDIWILMTS